MIKNNPETDKRSGYQKIDSDLNNQYLAFIDDSVTKKKKIIIISSLQSSLKRPLRAISVALNQFWDKYFEGLHEASLASKVTDKKLESTLNDKAKKLITNEIANVELATHSYSKKRQTPEGESSKSKRREVLPEGKEVDSEIDGVNIDNNE